MALQGESLRHLRADQPGRDVHGSPLSVSRGGSQARSGAEALTPRDHRAFCASRPFLRSSTVRGTRSGIPGTAVRGADEVAVLDAMKSQRIACAGVTKTSWLLRFRFPGD